MKKSPPSSGDFFISSHIQPDSDYLSGRSTKYDKAFTINLAE
ncbi:hypothetical protein [Halobacillus litoralis]|nr:hypothetical protein [Halobacillus litoralis]